jgi:hypothetical protein
MAKTVRVPCCDPAEEGVEAKVSESPDIKVSALSVVALARLREVLWQRLRWVYPARFRLGIWGFPLIVFLRSRHDAQRRTPSNREQRGPHRSASFISSLYFRYAT